MIDAPAPPCLASHLHYRSEGCTDATNNLTNKATIRFHCFKRSSFRGWRRVRMYVRISSYISDLPETFRRKNDCATKVRLYYMRICTGDICGQDGGGHGGTAGLPIRIQAGFCPPCSSNLTPVDQQPSSTCPLLQYLCGTYSLCKHVSNLKGSGQAHSSQGPMWRTVGIGTALSDAHLSGSSISPQRERCAMHFPRRRAG